MKKFGNILKDRNISSHIYEEKEAERIYHSIKDYYILEFEKLENLLKSKLK